MNNTETTDPATLAALAAYYGTPSQIADAQDKAMADSILADIERCGFSEY